MTQPVSFQWPSLRGAWKAQRTMILTLRVNSGFCSGSRVPYLTQSGANTIRFVNLLLQATSRGEGHPVVQIKWLNPPECCMLSAWRMSSWFVLISEYEKWETKREKKQSSPRFTLVSRPATVLDDVLYVVFPVLTHQWPIHSMCGFKWNKSQTASIFFFFPSWGSLNNLQTKSLVHLQHIKTWPPAVTSTPSEAITRQIIYGNEKALFLLPCLLDSKRTDPIGPSLSLNSLSSVGSDGSGLCVTLTLCASLNHMELQLPNSFSSPASLMTNAGESAQAVEVWHHPATFWCPTVLSLGMHGLYIVNEVLYCSKYHIVA